MNTADLEARLADQLLVQVGWQRHPQRPGCFQHPGAGLHVLIFPGEIVLTFGVDGHDRPDKELSVRTTLYPQTGINMIVEAATALVLQRTLTAHRGRGRKGPGWLPAGDMLLILCAQQGVLTAPEAAADPQWTIVAGWSKQPAVSTVVKAVYELRGAGLLETGDRRMRLTPAGGLAAAEIAHQLQLPLPDPVGST